MISYKIKLMAPQHMKIKFYRRISESLLSLQLAQEMQQNMKILDFCNMSKYLGREPKIMRQKYTSASNKILTLYLCL